MCFAKSWVRMRIVMRSGGYPPSVHTLRRQRQPESRFRGRRQSSCIKPRQARRRRALPTDYRWLPVPSSLCSQTLTHTATNLTVEMNDWQHSKKQTLLFLLASFWLWIKNLVISLKFISHYESYDKALSWMKSRQSWSVATAKWMCYSRWKL